MDPARFVIDRSISPPSCLPADIDRDELIDITNTEHSWRVYQGKYTGKIYDGSEFAKQVEQLRESESRECRFVTGEGTRVMGVARDSSDNKCLLVYLDRHYTDDDMLRLHNVLRERFNPPTRGNMQ